MEVDGESEKKSLTELMIPFNLTAVYVAFIRFMRNILLYLEECLYASKDNLISTRRRVMKLTDSVLGTKPESLGSSSVCNGGGGFLKSLTDSVNDYCEENDPDYEPLDEISESCTESGESESDISVEEINGFLRIKEKNLEI